MSWSSGVEVVLRVPIRPIVRRRSTVDVSLQQSATQYDAFNSSHLMQYHGYIEHALLLHIAVLNYWPILAMVPRREGVKLQHASTH